MWHVVRGRGARTPDRTPRHRARAGLSRRNATALIMTLALALGAAAQRPFEHRRHENVRCVECHGTADRHGTVSLRSPLDCASCHHDADRNLSCARCHDPVDLPEDRTVAQVLVLSTTDVVRHRALPFGHELHTATVCRDCHEAPVTLAATRPCASCHEQHHRADADCRACHGSEVQAAHQVEAHLSCAAAGCHSTRTLPPLNASRMLCLACHPLQADHEPGDNCASCHQVPGAGARS
jgi:hypothetical protein